MANFIDFMAVEEVYNTALKEINSITTYAIVVAGIGALLYLSAKIWKEWANGGQINFYGLLRPFAILLVLLNFSIVPVVLDTLTAPLTIVTEELRDSKNEEYNKKVAEIAELQKNKANESVNNIAESDWSIKGIYIKVCEIANIVEYFNPVSQAMYWGRQAMSALISTIAQYLCTAIAACILIFAYLTKIILVLVGPLVFGLSIFPGFGNVLQQWLCRYINVCLWIPICNIIGYMNQSLVIATSVDNAIKAINENALMTEQIAMMEGNNFVITLFMIISIIMYAMVPKIANWIISGDGSGMFSDAIGSTAGRVGSVAARSIGGRMATKGIGKEVGKQFANSVQK